MIRTLTLLYLLLLTTPSFAKEYQVYYLGGQSNMEGFGTAKDLPEDQRGDVAGVRIFHSTAQKDAVPIDGRGTWTTLKPGHGTGFSTDGKTPKYSDRFGVELSFARQIQQLNPNTNIALIKYARNGSSIAIEAAGQFGCWDPDFASGEGAGKGINQYDQFLATIRHATAVRDIDGDGEDDTLVPAGILWMQGESDATRQNTAELYEANLKRLMNLIRAALRHDDVPVVIGRISDSNHNNKPVWAFGPTVRDAQAAFCEKDAAAALVTSTDQYQYSDPWHYDAAGYLDLGKQFAEAMHRLQAK